MSWIVVKLSHFRPAVLRLLQVLTADKSNQRHEAASPRLSQAAGAVHVWLATILLLIAWQSAEVSSSFASFLNSPAWTIPHVAWDALFALAAWFTVQANLERAPQQVASELLTRILIPFWLTVLLSCFLLGPLMSLRGTSSYFRDQDTWTYLFNLVGWPQFRLPGVFEF